MFFFLFSHVNVEIHLFYNILIIIFHFVWEKHTSEKKTKQLPVDRQTCNRLQQCNNAKKLYLTSSLFYINNTIFFQIPEQSVAGHVVGVHHLLVAPQPDQPAGGPGVPPALLAILLLHLLLPPHLRHGVHLLQPCHVWQAQWVRIV